MMDYEKIRDEAKRRKAELLERQRQIKHDKTKLDSEDDQIKRELIGLDQVIEGLNFVTSDVPPDFEPTGFTDSIRKILTETSEPLVPTQIRDSLQERGISGSSAKNLLINVHKVLERIAPELDETAMPDGKIAYKHKKANRPPRSLAPVVDLMAALKQSLATMENKDVEAYRRKVKAELSTLEAAGRRAGRKAGEQ